MDNKKNSNQSNSMDKSMINNKSYKSTSPNSNNKVDFIQKNK